MLSRFAFASALVATALVACGPLESVASTDFATASAAPPQLSCAARLSRGALTMTLDASASEGRNVPLTVLAPSEAGSYPLIAFSHGAFASPARYAAMLEPLAGAGFVIVAPMHIDSEDYPRAAGEPERPAHPITWATRNEDFALALDPPAPVTAALAGRGIAIDAENSFALGHSYGALIAQLAGGALAFEPDGSQVSRANAAVDAVVGWSPPGPMPGFMAAQGWASLTAPSLTITGTADILPGFADDWQAHRAAHDNAPKGARALWVGEGVDHYFGGVFGRIKPEPGSANRALFQSALARTLHFIGVHGDAAPPCALGRPVAGEMIEEDRP